MPMSTVRRHASPLRSTARPSAEPRLRPLATPRSIRVRADRHHRPLALWTGRGWTAVAAIREEWRIDDEWWRVPVSRDYRVVVLESGRVETIYRDRLTSDWYRQG